MPAPAVAHNQQYPFLKAALCFPCDCNMQFSDSAEAGSVTNMLMSHMVSQCSNRLSEQG